MDYDCQRNAQAYSDSDLVKYMRSYTHLISDVYAEIGVMSPEMFRKRITSKDFIEWGKESIDNLLYVCSMVGHIIAEIKARKIKCDCRKASNIISYVRKTPLHIRDIGVTGFTQSMDRIYQISEDPVECCRQWYRKTRKKTEWSKNLPEWYTQKLAPQPKLIEIVISEKSESIDDMIELADILSKLEDEEAEDEGEAGYDVNKMWDIIDNLEWAKHMDVMEIKKRVGKLSMEDFLGLQKFVADHEIMLMNEFIESSLLEGGDILDQLMAEQDFTVSIRIGHIIGCGKRAFDMMMQYPENITNIKLDTENCVFTRYIYLDKYSELVGD